MKSKNKVANYSLESVQTAFSQWRLKCKKKSGRIPMQLWEQVDSLLIDYSAKALSKALNISHDAVKQRIAKQNQTSIESSPQFIEVASPAEREETQVMIQRSDGAKMSIHVCGDTDLGLLVTSFMGERT